MASSIIASTLTRRLKRRRNTSHQRPVSACAPAHVGQQHVTAALADEHRQESVDESDEKKQELEEALPGLAPPKPHRVAEHGARKPAVRNFSSGRNGTARTGLIMRRFSRSRR